MKLAKETTFVTIASFILLILSPDTSDAQVHPDSIRGVAAVSDVYPSWSPDGKQIVFQSDRDAIVPDRYHIYIMDLDGKNVRKLTSGNSSDETPAWSPDGSTILYSSYISGENNELFTISSDGSQIRRLTNHPLRDGHQHYSPDGVHIIFNSQRDDDGTNEEKNYEIYEMDIDGSNIKRLTVFPGWDTYPSISPDGSTILWRRVLPTGGNSSTGRNSEIFLMNRDGSNPRNISNNAAFDGYPAWSPDGSKIVFASNRTEQGGRANFHVYVMNADGSNVMRLIENDGTVDDARPVWSPDGSMILFNREYIRGVPASRIMVVNLPEGIATKQQAK